MSVPHGRWHIDTQAVHSGEGQRYAGAAVTPIFQSSTYVFDGDTSRGYDAVKYARCNNTPNHDVSVSSYLDRQSVLFTTTAQLEVAKLVYAFLTSLIPSCRSWQRSWQP